jgi:AcrR family transcriptional regulator
MAWNVEHTQQRLMDAALVEFAAAGPAGTTVERIARRAGVNKERLYKYFGDRDRLFAVVVGDHLASAAAAVPLPEIHGPEAVGDYAAALFDYHGQHPELVRLLVWEGLLDDGTTASEEVARRASYQEKVDVFTDAQSRGVITAEIPPPHLLFATLSLAGWWYAVPQVARMMGADPARRRVAVAAAATDLARGTVR